MRRRRNPHHRRPLRFRPDCRPAGRLPAAQRAAMRFLHAWNADRGAGTSVLWRRAQPRYHSRAFVRQLLPLYRLPGHRRRHRIGGTNTRPSAGGKGRLTMNELATRDFAKPATLSERADEIEERMMHELGERIATKSVLFGMADGKVEMQS